MFDVIGSVDHARKATIHHYHKSFRGFSARLTHEQANRIAKSGSVVSVFKSRLCELHTTRSWDFMRATGESPFGHFSEKGKYDVVIGHIDSGVWPESPSFTPGDGMDAWPEGFKGQCVTGEQFSSSNCNGARRFQPRDPHSLNSRGCNGNRHRRARGRHTARGGAPKARLAVYKACWFNHCEDSDVLKAFDDAIDDGVDVITISVGHAAADRSYSFLEDAISIGAFHAFLKRIVTSAAAGNFGSMGPGFISNTAPWTLTVAASSIDREFVSNIQLGNGNTLKGYGWNSYQMNGFYYVIAGVNAAGPGVRRQDARFCQRNTLDNSIIQGKVVVCLMETSDDDYSEKSSVVRSGGGVGMIVVDPYDEKDLHYFEVPTSVINQDEANNLRNYMASTSEHYVKILSSVINYDVKPAPKMAFFSSKGPYHLAPEIIKPDITAPGVNILASGPVMYSAAANTPNFFLDSGTSMACPHVSGVAAVIKAINPDWSAAEVKSAIMTTALPGDNIGNPIQSNAGRATPFDMGSGHLNPNAALNPGLVYDMSETDVYYFLCSHGVNIDILRMLFENNRANCPNGQMSAYHLNLPSIGINNLVGGVSVTRKVTYRGNENGSMVFNVRIENPQGIEITVSPSVLDFSGGQKTLTFTVDVYPSQRLGKFVFGSLTWYNSIHEVRSPIAVKAVYN
ncbi:hypothetical protein Vadar_030316 [Vaccinium darrowii]|uniref:Uncharacterized protein n=1 Tax=Vaccinium darrowii TaxID=229202 RepID=A0ACB7YRV3_9ERIC|nr:hypothetical protein Vadar_030316 [Vaccinium darrowii]